MANDATFITTIETSGDGPTVAVKDLIDVAGVPTTAGSRAVAERAASATADAACLAGFRDAGARLIGKANLHELAFGAAGVNKWYGTPENPFDAACVPGGSSSGSAVAVATAAARLALGSDTGGSIRVPAAFCGICGLKTTFGRVPLEGVWPLAPSLDTVGPMAADIRALIETMALLEPGFAPGAPASVIGRIHPAGVEVDPTIDAAVDGVLGASGLEVRDLVIPAWGEAFRRGMDLLVSEAAEQNAPLLADPDATMKIAPQVRARLESAREVDDGRRKAAREGRGWFVRELAAAFSEVQLLALPSVAYYPPPLEQAYERNYTSFTMPVNLAGFPALSLPVPSGGRFPASLQLVGQASAEELLCATALLLEGAASSL